jgi:hypothetical protein
MKASAPIGSKQQGRPLSNAERQRRFRERRDARFRELEGMAPLRNSQTVRPLDSLRNVAPSHWTEETIDDLLTQLRRRGDRLVADYVALLTTRSHHC